MTQEEKELLLKDLCARLSYGVVVQEPDYYEAPLTIATMSEVFYNGLEVKPYLRPMSSMTEEEFLTIYDMCWPKNLEFKSTYGSYWGDFKTKKYIPYFMYNSNQIDYLTSHHFDYRGLIEKGLALEAPEGMYK